MSSRILLIFSTSIFKLYQQSREGAVQRLRSTYIRSVAFARLRSTEQLIACNHQKMGLMTILRKVKMKEHEMRLLMLGLDNAGKTTVVKHLKGEDVRSVSPTLGFDICTMAHGDYTLNIWDVGGQQTIRSYWRNYFEATDAIIWVVDSADVSRIDICRQELETVLQEERLAGASLLILANKQDLPGALDGAQIADRLHLDGSIGRKRHWRVFSCSALSTINSPVAHDASARLGPAVSELENALNWLIADVGSRIFLMD
jgi:ADP-ribosylation factor-like protein 2